MSEPITTLLTWYKTSEKKPPIDKACLVYIEGHGTWVACYQAVWYPDGNKDRWHCIASPLFQHVCNTEGNDPLWTLKPRPVEA